MFPSKKIGKYERLVLIILSIFLVVLIFLEFEFPCLTNKYPLTFAIIAGIFSGIISAIVLLYLQERHYLHQLDKYYSDVAGKYTRVDMGQDNTSDEAMDYMKKQNVNLRITLIHDKGSNSFRFSAEYWKKADALAEGIIEFNDKNGTSAYGRYTYTRANDVTNDVTLGDSGTFKIYRLEEDKTKLLVQYHHLFPRRLENNPDKNKGWEIWQKNNVDKPF